jgi:prepilin-type N-terminal cleavage/methylation domain-containing protein
MNSQIKTSRGFSLIELMVALVIFAIGISALILTHAGIMQNNTRSINRSAAMVELENLMEEGIAYSKRTFADGRSGYDHLWDIGEAAAPHTVINDNVLGIQRQLVVEQLTGTRESVGMISLAGIVIWSTGAQVDTLDSRVRITRHD